MGSSYLFERTEHLKKHVKSDYMLADIWDRLAAFVLDFIIIFLLANIFCAPYKKRIQAAYLAENDGIALYLTLACALITFLTFVFYHTIQLYFTKQTIGKRVFKIKVEHILPDQQLTFWAYFLRSIYLFFSVLFFFIPFIEIFSNPLRRPLHDRFADTYVKGLSRQMDSPNIVEHLWVKLVLLVFFANLTVFFVAVVYFEKPNRSSNFFSEILIPDEYVCSEVTVAYENQENVDQTRLSLALTLYSADMIDKNCLEMEAQRAISFDDELDNAYLAKAFVYEDEYELSNEYLLKTCEVNKDGEACMVSQIVDLWSARRWKEATEIFKNSEFKTYSQVWAIKHFDKVQDHERVLKTVHKLFPNRTISSFLSEYKTLALKSLNKLEAADLLFESVYEDLNDENRLNFVVQSCYRDLDNNCSAKPQACRLLLNNENIPYHLKNEESLVVTYVKAAKCGMSNLDEVISDIKNRIEDPKLQLFIAAMKAETLNNENVSKRIYKSIIQNSNSLSLINYEARLRLLELAKTDEDFNEQIELLSSIRNSPYLKSFSQKLLFKLAYDKKWKLADNVALEVARFEGITRELKNILAVVFFENKKWNLAKKFIVPDLKTRTIASMDNNANRSDFSDRIKEISEILSEDQR